MDQQYIETVAPPLWMWITRLAQQNNASRDFHFVLPGDHHLPRQSVESLEDFRRHLIMSGPVVHLGAWYNDTNTPVLRPFTLDVDLSDVTFRECCGATKGICSVCWAKYAMPAVRAIDAFLSKKRVPRSDILWVFSGKKGYHLWINNLYYATLTSKEREAFLWEMKGAVRDGAQMETDGERAEFVPDERVSTDLRRTLRMPYSVRPENGNVCVAFDGATPPRLEELTTKQQDMEQLQKSLRFLRV